ncbi:RRS1-domain-containing protein [Tothia fuscella]|uniref:Ribosome biogenesis regulatory protein n=1 Tax=Tothia fuscella TaxID=1048955 RepID=A0A9P4U1Z8_9PEZI|nr:RRS1-domain-containing protein [Tothia fuscella]
MAELDMEDAPVLASPTSQLQSELEDGVQLLNNETTTPSTNGNHANILSNGKSRAPITVSKPIPYTFDLGHLLCNDTNPIPQNPTQADLTAIARDCAQSLLNQLLTTCPITSTPEGVHLTLPTPTTPLPREKNIPPPKEETTWEKFAKKKGIQSKKRVGNKVYDDATGEWVPKWGFGGKNKGTEDSWLVEVDGEKEQREGKADDGRRDSRAERKMVVKRQERREKGNERRAVKNGN